jgi:N-acyl-D-amino-acid deacylase
MNGSAPPLESTPVPDGRLNRNRRTRWLVVLLVAGAAAATVAWTFHARFSYDLVIVNGRIVDGSGARAFAADIGIRDGRIVRIGQFSHSGVPALDARGSVVAPGFIDIHTHAEGVYSSPEAANFVRMGVTTIVTGNCGSSALNVSRFLDAVASRRPAVNVGTLIGHNTIRSKVLGRDDRPPRAEELREMEDLVARGMKDGAFGLSTGLIYVPGTYAQTAEILTLARVAALHGGIYATHVRDEGSGIFGAIGEAVSIGEGAGLPVEVSHFKITSRNLWERSEDTLQLISQARDRGLRINVDQYAYTASSTSLDVLLPSWVRGGGREELRGKLADPQTRERVAREMAEDLKNDGFDDYSFAIIARYEADASLAGKSIAEVARGGLREQIERIIEMCAAGGADMIYHKMSEQDVRRIMAAPFTIIASDSGVDKPGEGVPHPRGYGNNARVLGLYARELGLLTLEDAVRKMTSLPAQTVGLRERGLIREGYAADLVIFNYETIGSPASFTEPRQPAAGISHVIVNGDVVLANGEMSGSRPGHILRLSEPGRLQRFSAALRKLLSR